MDEQEKSPASPSVTCGIIMPLSPIDGLSEKHWGEVRTIVEDSINDAKMHPRLVSDADDVGIIQKRIIQNIFSDPMVVCDVSAKNPNVMFELGMRLAFDKPVVIIKDDRTEYSFDTAPIEHLTYPRDLRFASIVDFKEQLTKKLVATHHKSDNDTDYTTFLKHFGTFKVAELESEEVSGDELILNEIQELRSAIGAITRKTLTSRPNLSEEIVRGFDIIHMAIKDFAKGNKIKSKVVAREQMSQFLEFVDHRTPARRYFPSEREFHKAFRIVFRSLYG